MSASGTTTASTATSGVAISRISISQRVVLLTGGVVAILLGVAILFFPHAIHESSGVDLGDDPNLMSEIRSPGGALLGIGALLVMGAFVQALTLAATVSGAIVYLGYAVGRVVSMALDGIPGPALLTATAVELAVGAALVWCLWRHRIVPS